MFDIFKAIILGIVEGVTEFLPISSTGHLILVNQFITFSKHFTNMFDIIIQLGAILAVIVYFRKRLVPSKLSLNSFVSDPSFSIWKKAVIGVIPALILGALFHKKIEELLFNPGAVSIALFIGGVLLIIIENRKKKVKINSIANLGYGTALLIGLIQCFSMIPGTSRSAATIIGAMLLGCSRVAAVEFSFFLAIPTIAAASAYSLFKLGFALSGFQIIVLLTGFIVSFIAAWVVIAGFMKYISKRDFKPFGYYRIVLGAVVIIYYFFIK